MFTAQRIRHQYSDTMVGCCHLPHLFGAGFIERMTRCKIFCRFQREGSLKAIISIETLCGTCICKQASSGDVRKIFGGAAIDKRWRLGYQDPLRTRSFAFVVRDEQLSLVQTYRPRLHISVLKILEASVRSFNSFQQQKNSYLATFISLFRITETERICQLRTVERRLYTRGGRDTTLHMSR